MDIFGRVGRITAATGSRNPLVTNKDGALVAAIAGGNRTEAALAGRLFAVANQAPVATTAAGTGTWTGLCISNPTGSGYDLIMHEFNWAMSVVGSDDGMVGVCTCTIAAPAAVIIPVNMKRGGAASVAYIDDGATIVGSALILTAGSIGMGATNLVMGQPPNVYDFKGGLILTPGYTLASWTQTATTATASFGFVWEEVVAS